MHPLEVDKTVDKVMDFVSRVWDLANGVKPPTYDSKIEESIYNLCKEYAYKANKPFVFNGLHKAFKETIEQNINTPARIHRELRRVIYRDVAKIENTEVRDNVIFQYALIYNLKSEEGKTK